MKLIVRRIIAFYLDAFFVLIMFGLFVLIIYLIDDTIDLSLIGIPLYGYYLTVLIFYFFLVEFFFEVTLAKKIVGVKVKCIEEKSFSMFFFRTIIRFIPLDAISFLFNNKNDLWHDTLSKTRVVDSKN
jgi:uncharacterized RDD family membrane protein YckC